MKSASVEVTITNESKVASLTSPRIFLDISETTKEPEDIPPGGVGVSSYSTSPASIQCVGVLSYQLGSSLVAVMFETPVAMGELCPNLGLFVTQDLGLRDRQDMYSVVKGPDPSPALQRKAVFRSNENELVRVSLAQVQVSGTMTYDTNSLVKVWVRDVSSE
eukprot:gi/632963001/ref/XP_007897638.1/ PREDICTED: uncharacterized protein LOC103182428 [Callorhinchus milii]